MQVQYNLKAIPLILITPVHISRWGDLSRRKKTALLANIWGAYESPSYIVIVMGFSNEYSLVFARFERALLSYLSRGDFIYDKS